MSAQREAKQARDRASARRRSAALRGLNPQLVTSERRSLARITIPAAVPVSSGLCTGEGDLFFSEDPGEQDLARRICQGCPSRWECLAGALERAEPCGVWGGELLDRGRVVITEIAG